VAIGNVYLNSTRQYAKAQRHFTAFAEEYRNRPYWRDLALSDAQFAQKQEASAAGSTCGVRNSK